MNKDLDKKEPSLGSQEPHFDQIARHYRSVRDTDFEPIKLIVEAFASVQQNSGCYVDLSCGTGRYTELWVQALQRHSKLSHKVICIDASQSMLKQAEDRLKEPGTRFIGAPAENLPLENASVDGMLTSNAIHHYDIQSFLAQAARVLRPKAKLCIYTRFQDQNARTIWGQYFPDFTKTETRLFHENQLVKEIEKEKKFVVQSITQFRFQRKSSIKSLVERTRNYCYSTFSLYSPKQFQESLQLFEKRLLATFPDPKNVEHTAENALLVAQRTDY